MQIIYELILSYQKLNYLRWYNQEDFLVDLINEKLMKNVIKPLAKSVLIPLGLTAAAVAAAADAGIHKKS